MTSLEANWELPEPLSTVEVAVGEGTSIIVRRHGNPDGPRMVMSHGNGLAIDLYYPFWSLLADDFDLIIYDLRNHGRNALGPLAHHHIPALARDQDLLFAAIDAHYGAKPKTGVFHSASSLAALLAPSNGSDLTALVLFDPPLRKPGIELDEAFDEASRRVAAAARQRSSRFTSREELAGLAEFSPNFRRVLPGVLELLARTTLRQSPSGDGYELCCPPEYEARVVEYARVFGSAVDLAGYGCPIKAIGADPTLQFAYLPAADLSGMVGVDYDFLPDATHFLQLEQPENCVALMLEFLEQQGII